MRNPSAKELRDLVGLSRSSSCRNCTYRDENFCNHGAGVWESFPIPGKVANTVCDNWMPMGKIEPEY